MGLRKDKNQVDEEGEEDGGMRFCVCVRNKLICCRFGGEEVSWSSGDTERPSLEAGTEHQGRRGVL